MARVSSECIMKFRAEAGATLGTVYKPSAAAAAAHVQLCRWPSRFKVPNRARFVSPNPRTPPTKCLLFGFSSAFCCVVATTTTTAAGRQQQQQQENVMNIKHLLTFVHRCYRRQRWRWQWRVGVAVALPCSYFAGLLRKHHVSAYSGVGRQTRVEGGSLLVLSHHGTLPFMKCNFAAKGKAHTQNK